MVHKIESLTKVMVKIRTALQSLLSKYLYVWCWIASKHLCNYPPVYVQIGCGSGCLCFHICQCDTYNKFPRNIGGSVAPQANCSLTNIRDSHVIQFFYSSFCFHCPMTLKIALQIEGNSYHQNYQNTTLFLCISQLVL